MSQELLPTCFMRLEYLRGRWVSGLQQRHFKETNLKLTLKLLKLQRGISPRLRENYVIRFVFLWDMYVKNTGLVRVPTLYVPGTYRIRKKYVRVRVLYVLAVLCTFHLKQMENKGKLGQTSNMELDGLGLGPGFFSA